MFILGGTAPKFVPPYDSPGNRSHGRTAKIGVGCRSWHCEHKYTLPLALFQEKNFILGRKSLRRKDLTMILLTFKICPHFGSRAEISEMV
jgi:hypothetical protein